QAKVVNFAAATAALDLRESTSNDRYDVGLLANGHLQIRRYNGATTTVLGDVASGIADLGNWATIALQATGARPVQLVASVSRTRARRTQVRSTPGLRMPDRRMPDPRRQACCSATISTGRSPPAWARSGPSSPAPGATTTRRTPTPTPSIAPRRRGSPAPTA